MTIIIAVLIAAVAVAIVAWPIIQGGRLRLANGEEADPVLAELMARREAILTAIKDLEFDHAVGKVEEEDFRVLDTRLRAEAVEVLKEIDQRLGGDMASLDAQLEAEIARRRRRVPAATLEEQVEAEIAALRRQARTQPIASVERTCTQCGAPLDEGDRFCSRCGTPVASPQTSG